MVKRSRASTNSKSSTNKNDISKKLDDSDAVSVCSMASNEDLDIELDEKEEDSFTLPESDMNYHRRIFIMKSCSNTGEIHRLPHPKFGKPVLFLIDKEGNPFELMKQEQPQKRSIFVDDSVVSDPGPFVLFLPVHPLFLVLPLLENVKETFLSFDELLSESPLKILSTNDKLLKTLILVAEYQEINGISKYRLKDDLLVGWLNNKFTSLRETVRRNVKEIEGRGDSFLDYYTIGILADYLTQSTEDMLRFKLSLKKEDEMNQYCSTDTSTKKRCYDQPANKVVPAKKRPSKFSQVSTSGMQSLRTFFGKKLSNTD